MKNSKRMLAVVAASGLVLGGLPGVANAQSEELLDLNLNLNIGDSVGLGVDLGLGSLGVNPGELDPEDFPALTGSLGDLEDAGSSDLASGSDDFGPALEEALEAGSSGGSGSDFDDLSSGSDFDDLSSGSDSASDDLPSGSDSASDDLPSGSDSASDDLPSGSDSASDELTTGSDSASDELEEELDGGLSSDSLGSDSEGSSGSDNGGDTADPSIFDRISEWISDLFDSGSDSASDEAGSDSASDELEEELGGGLSSDSLGSDSEGSSGSDNGGDTADPSIFDQIGEWISDLFDGGSSDSEGGEGSSDSEGGSTGSDSNDEGTDDETEGEGEDTGDTVINSAELDADVLLAVGSLAAAGIAVGIAANGGVNLPPLPGVDVGVVCELPQEGIDFLKGNGSMQPDECLPEN